MPGRRIAEGNTAEIYQTENRVIKVFKPHLPETEAEKEAQKQRFAFAAGLPVPEVIDVTPLEGRPAIIMAHAQGKTFGDLFLENRERAEELLALSIDIQHTVHSHSAEGLESMTGRLRRQIEAAHPLSEKQRTLLLRKLEEMPAGESLCHGDFHLFNLIQGKQEVTILDWVDASSGSREADICRTYLLYLQYSKDLAAMYLRLYGEGKGVSREAVLEWLPILAAARLSEHVPTENEDKLIQIVHKAYPE
ncbi:phosphotransferase family protein [Alteribacter natronophilus]|uniref:phosphotransferase family protein n=1 Tax=Alteribacter natronophilus TaxID=2583810 RepID=UPI00110DFED3|nr:phosphotransferase [Alteribacter natronophilus]TMW71254.1 aminoglycoside phosphotransferase family protein [Alteribacter natronophilus]